MTPLRRQLLSGAAAVLLAACGGGGTPEPSSSTGGTEEVVDVGPVQAPLPAPSDATPDVPLLAFSAPTVDGGTLDGAAYAGRDVAIWFWAPW